jgi:exonuclease SbcD
MRILCTGDLHIGKVVNQFSMIEDQSYILDQIINQIIENNVDVLVIAGDLYDRSIPSVEAVELLDNFLFKVIDELKKKVLIISGNHDSNERLHFGSRFLKNNGLFIQTKPNDIKVQIGDVNFFMIPYFHPKEIVSETEIRTYQDTIDYVLRDYDIDNSEMNICVYHGLVFGDEQAIESDSERIISVGTMGQVPLNTFSKFDYTILGHLHQNQRMSETIEYTGSPLKYSFSEVNHIKSTTLLVIEDKTIEREKLVLKPKRDFKVINGFFEEILNHEHSEDYVRIVLKDKHDIYEPIQRLRVLYPNVMILEKESMNISKPVSFTKSKKEDLSEVFLDFYEQVSKHELTEVEVNFIEQIKEEMI